MFKSPLLGGLPPLLLVTLIGSLGFFAAAQSPPAATLSPTVKEFVKFDDPAIAVIHVRVIDGTGQPSRPNQTLILRDGKIAAIGDTASTPIPTGAKVLDLRDHTVFPGLVGMHEHLFYTSALDPDADGKLVPHLSEIAFTAPRLYLAAGVTTIRTTGSIEPYTDLDLKETDRCEQDAGPEDGCHQSVPRRFS